MSYILNFIKLQLISLEVRNLATRITAFSNEREKLITHILCYPATIVLVTRLKSEPFGKVTIALLAFTLFTLFLLPLHCLSEIKNYKR